MDTIATPSKSQDQSQMISNYKIASTKYRSKIQNPNHGNNYVLIMPKKLELSEARHNSISVSHLSWRRCDLRFVILRYILDRMDRSVLDDSMMPIRHFRVLDCSSAWRHLQPLTEELCIGYNCAYHCALASLAHYIIMPVKRAFVHFSPNKTYTHSLFDAANQRS